MPPNVKASIQISYDLIHTLDKYSCATVISTGQSRLWRAPLGNRFSASHPRHVVRNGRIRKPFGTAECRSPGFVGFLGLVAVGSQYAVTCCESERWLHAQRPPAFLLPHHVKWAPACTNRGSEFRRVSLGSPVQAYAAPPGDGGQQINVPTTSLLFRAYENSQLDLTKFQCSGVIRRLPSLMEHALSSRQAEHHVAARRCMASPFGDTHGACFTHVILPIPTAPHLEGQDRRCR